MNTHDAERHTRGPSPLIGVTGMRRLGADIAYLPRFLHDVDVDIYVNHYTTGVSQAGGVPVLISRDSRADALVDRLDGLLVTGGEDVNPRLYGELPSAQLTGVDPVRDTFEIALVHAALEREIPILGICRGCQILNVALGGTLVGHLSKDEGERHSYLGYPGNFRSHGVTFDTGSELERVYGPSVMVNSFHHQAVSRPGGDIRITARASDGVAEGIELPGRQVIGVQWHPEMLDEDPAFSWLVGCSRAASTKMAGSV